MTTIVLQLPDDLAVRAQTAGILTDEGLMRLVQQELARQAQVKALRSDLQALRESSPPLSDEEVKSLIAAEIRAYRGK
jgi:hypothetical protein